MAFRKGVRKENLNWKINYLAAKTGENVYIQSAKGAAAAKRPNKRSLPLENVNKDDMKQELFEARRRKLETKLYQATRELKSVLKKNQRAEIQKQLKRSKRTTDDEDQQPNQGLNILKSVDLNRLAERTLREKLQTHTAFQSNVLASSIISAVYPGAPEAHPTDIDASVARIELQLLSRKPVQEEIIKLLNEVEAILIGRPAKKQEQDSANPRHSRAEKPQNDDSSLFVESLQDASGDSDNTSEDSDNEESRKEKSTKRKRDDLEWEDPDFDKIYNGDVKKNRPGQRERRQKWEQLYGKKANHVQQNMEKTKHGRQMNNGKTNRSRTPVKQSTGPTPEEMHPSWQAKRQQQEMMAKALSGQMGGTNKKIVFDD